MVRKALRGERDPMVTAGFALGRTWPLLLTLVFGSALIGNGVTGGWFIWKNDDFTRLVFGITAVMSCLKAIFPFRKHLVLAAMGTIMLCCTGRAWAIGGAYIDSRSVVDGGITTFLVGFFIWLALAVAEFVFTVALLTIVAVRTAGLTRRS